MSWSTLAWSLQVGAQFIAPPERWLLWGVIHHAATVRSTAFRELSRLVDLPGQALVLEHVLELVRLVFLALQDRL